jgi:hypothetical protein
VRNLIWFFEADPKLLWAGREAEKKAITCSIGEKMAVMYSGVEKFAVM